MSFKVASVFALFMAMASASGGVSSFAYGVSDPYTGDIKNQQESRVGDNVVGQYSLVESDGTKRIVDYAANAHSGFNAVVRKEPLYGHAAPVLAAAPLAPAAPLAYGAHASPLAYGAGSLAYGARAVSPLAYGAGSLAYGAQAVAPLAYAARAISPVAVSSYSSQLAHGGYAAPLAYGGYGASALGAYGASPLSLGHGSLGYSRLGW